MDQKQFDVAVALVKSTGEKMDGMLHECAMFSLEQLNLHGNNGAANRLLAAVSKSMRKEAMFVWFNDFGMCKRAKDNTLVYAGKKKLSWEGEQVNDLPSFLEIADENPFYEYTKEIPPVSSYDVAKGIANILKRVETGKTKGWELKHTELLESLRALLPEDVKA